MSHPHPDLGTPPAPPRGGLRITPLGGLGEIGRNMTVFEHAGRLLIVDCGVLFPEEHQPGVDVILPDFTSIRDRLTIAGGVATIRSPAGDWTLRPADDAIVYGPCAVARWLKILDLAVTKPSTKTIGRALKRAAVVDHRSPHVCHSGPVLGDTTRVVPLLPPIDQWGALPLPLQRLSPHSLSRRTRDLLAGDLGAHRDLPVDTDPEPVAATPEETARPHPGTRKHLPRGGRGRGVGPPPRRP